MQTTQDGIRYDSAILRNAMPLSLKLCLRTRIWYPLSSAKTKYDLFLNEIASPVVGPNVACRNTVHELPVRLTSLYIRMSDEPATHGRCFCRQHSAQPLEKRFR